MSDQKTIAKNSIYNVIGSFSPMVVTFVTVPIYIEHIGEGRYGILALVWLLLGYFGIFDLGLGKAVANQIAFYKDKDGKQNHERSIFWTCFVINLLMGIIGGILLFLVGPFIVHHMADNQSQYLKEVIKSLPILALSVPEIALSSVATGYFQGKEYFGILNTLQVARDILFQLLPLATALLIGPDLFYLIISAVVAKFIATSLLFVVLLIRQSLGSPIFDKQRVKDLLKYGGAISISNIISPILTSIDRFIIGAIVGAKAVTWYTIPFNLSSKVKRITSAFSRALFPKFSLLEKEEAQNLSAKAVFILMVFITPVVLIGFLIMRPFLILWIGQDLANKTVYVGYIILTGAWINNLAFIPFSYLRGQGKPGIVALIHAAEVIPFLIILWFMVKWRGVEGAALAWSLRVSVDAILLFYFSGLLKPIWDKIAISSLIIISSFILIYYNSGLAYVFLPLAIVGYVIQGYLRYKNFFQRFFTPLKTYFR